MKSHMKTKVHREEERDLREHRMRHKPKGHQGERGALFLPQGFRERCPSTRLTNDLVLTSPLLSSNSARQLLHRYFNANWLRSSIPSTRTKNLNRCSGAIGSQVVLEVLIQVLSVSDSGKGVNRRVVDALKVIRLEGKDVCVHKSKCTGRWERGWREIKVLA